MTIKGRLLSDVMMEPTLREYLEQRLDYERSLVAQKFELIDRALQHQAAEYERRLTVLNHAHEAAVKEQARVLPREMFDTFRKEYDGFKHEVASLRNEMVRNATLEALIKDQDGFKREYQDFKLMTTTQLTAISTRAITWTAAIALAFALISFAMRFIQ